MVTDDGCETTLTADNDGCQNAARQCRPTFRGPRQMDYFVFITISFEIFPNLSLRRR